MTDAEYEVCQNQILLFAGLVRELPLADFLARANHTDSVGALLAPSHWIAGHEKLALVVKLAERLRAFQAAIPSLEEATGMDARADRLRERLGV
jgi:hypothetical protein